MSEDWDIDLDQYETEIEIDPSSVEAADDEVVCRVCSQTFGQITAQHLRLHDLSLDEYREQYPEASVYPDDPDRQPGGALDSHTGESKAAISRTIAELHREGRYE